MITRVYLLAAVLAVAACTPEVGSEKWCKALQETPKTQWSVDEGFAYTKHCFVSQATIGSAQWCGNLSETPKGDWTVEEAKSYARYCVVRMPETDES